MRGPSSAETASASSEGIRPSSAHAARARPSFASCCGRRRLLARSASWTSRSSLAKRRMQWARRPSRPARPASCTYCSREAGDWRWST